MSTIERLLTAEEYAQLPDNGEPTELVRSPSDRWPKILRRVSEFLNAGVLAVYVVDYQKQSVTVFDAETDPPGRTLTGDDMLTLPEPLGGLRMTVREILS